MLVPVAENKINKFIPTFKELIPDFSIRFRSPEKKEMAKTDIFMDERGDHYGGHIYRINPIVYFFHYLFR